MWANMWENVTMTGNVVGASICAGLDRVGQIVLWAAE
jgi:hypothetical protein